MKKVICFLLLSLLVSSCPLLAQTGPTGVWQGDLDMGKDGCILWNIQMGHLQQSGGCEGIQFDGAVFFPFGFLPYRGFLDENAFDLKRAVRTTSGARTKV